MLFPVTKSLRTLYLQRLVRQSSFVRGLRCLRGKKIFARHLFILWTYPSTGPFQVCLTRGNSPTNSWAYYRSSRNVERLAFHGAPKHSLVQSTGGSGIVYAKESSFTYLSSNHFVAVSVSPTLHVRMFRCLSPMIFRLSEQNTSVVAFLPRVGLRNRSYCPMTCCNHGLYHFFFISFFIHRRTMIHRCAMLHKKFGKLFSFMHSSNYFY